MCLLHTGFSIGIQQVKYARSSERCDRIRHKENSEVLTSTRIFLQKFEADPHSLGVCNRSYPLRSSSAPRISGLLPDVLGDLLLCSKQVPEACLDFY